VNDQAEAAAFQASELERVGKLFSWRFGKSAKKKKEALKEIQRGERQAEREKQLEDFSVQREGRNKLVAERTDHLLQKASSLNPAGDGESVRSSSSRHRSSSRSQRHAPGMDEEEREVDSEIQVHQLSQSTSQLIVSQSKHADIRTTLVTHSATCIGWSLHNCNSTRLVARR